jgi:hypothetical protein
MMESKHEKELKQEDPKFEKTVFCDYEIRVLIVCIEGKEYKFINATDLTKASDIKNKVWSHYIENKGKKLFLEKLSRAVGIPRKLLVQSITRNCPERGTWVHPKVAINFAEWISHDFAIKVTDWVLEWAKEEANYKKLMHELANLQANYSDQREREIQLKLKEKLGAVDEVKTESGRIDLLTEDAVIEIKDISNWKHALGQVLAYSIHYPDHKRVVYLFGELPDNIDTIARAFQLNNIKLNLLP